MRYMVTIQIKWDGKEDTEAERAEFVRSVVSNLPCIPVSPVKTADDSYICVDAVVNLLVMCGEVTIDISGVSKAVFEYATTVASMIKKYIENKLGSKEWSEGDYETRVYVSLYEAEVRCRCEA